MDMIQFEIMDMDMIEPKIEIIEPSLFLFWYVLHHFTSIRNYGYGYEWIASLIDPNLNWNYGYEHDWPKFELKLWIWIWLNRKLNWPKFETKDICIQIMDMDMDMIE